MKDSLAHEPRPGEFDDVAVLLRPILETGPAFYWTAALLLAIVAWGVYGFTQQIANGLQVT
ncbi:MAG: hypothetical protein HY303_16175 [Candidatus Wallbacteria bacterium]|nr:hypothetical protein [Candidatus Wallbacteria bacterium]